MERTGKMIYILLLMALIFLPVTSHGGDDISSPRPYGDIGIYEKSGENVPLDLTFFDESGNKVDLRHLINRPTILVLAYYGCSDICSNVLTNVAGLLGKLKADPERDYSVITVSFDEKDTPTEALQKKEDYIRAIDKPFPRDAWRFLTGDLENIRKLTGSVGFKFQRQGDGFQHPATLIVLSPEGKIIRYLYGTTYLPFDVLMALSEASVGRTGPAIPRALLFCYRYDPQGRTYVFNILRVTGVVTLLSAAAFIIYLTSSNRSKGRT